MLDVNLITQVIILVMMLNLCEFKVGHWDRSRASCRWSPGTLLNKKMVSSEDARVGASEFQGEHNSVLLVDESSESRKVNIWRALGSLELECLAEVTFFCVKQHVLSVVESVRKNLRNLHLQLHHAKILELSLMSLCVCLFSFFGGFPSSCIEVTSSLLTCGISVEKFNKL